MYCSIVDAILGALTLPDIGQLFPDNDPNWKGADSSIFMEEVTILFIRFDFAPFSTFE
jgi:2-C-methyl-D-erythritol 2,4-cyclodiphosphate synthase